MKLYCGIDQWYSIHSNQNFCEALAPIMTKSKYLLFCLFEKKIPVKEYAIKAPKR